MELNGDRNRADCQEACVSIKEVRDERVSPLHDLGLGLPARPFEALRHKERYRTKAADALTDLVKEHG